MNDLINFIYLLTPKQAIFQYYKVLKIKIIIHNIHNK